MFGVRKAPTGCNFVHSDEIWKDHVRRELQASRKWPEKWGVLAASNRTQVLEHEYTGPYKLMKDVKNANMENKSEGGPRHPQTTAREVGLRHSHFKELEMYGRPARGQLSIDKQLKWPREGIM